METFKQSFTLDCAEPHIYEMDFMFHKSPTACHMLEDLAQKEEQEARALVAKCKKLADQAQVWSCIDLSFLRSPCLPRLLCRLISFHARSCFPWHFRLSLLPAACPCSLLCTFFKSLLLAFLQD